MLMKWTCVFALLMALAVTGTAFGTTYYVDSAAGNDSFSGTSTSAAWRTLARASAQSYDPGDQILLKRGCVWQEPAFFPVSSGAAGLPIVLADYGTGALPQITGNAGALTDSAVILRNVSYWTLRNLDLTQTGPQPPTPPGENPDYGDQWLKPVLEIRGLYDGTVAHVRVENCLVHGGGWNGIYIMGGFYQDNTGVSGYADDVVVDGVEAYSNGKAGIEASCRYTKTIIYFTTNVSVINTIAHDNGGDGVVMGPSQYGLIDNCVAYHNGVTTNARVGLWFWDSQYCTIQNSESYGNVVPPEQVGQSSARDGSGFDLDLGTMDCVIQYCYSHDNMGEGYLLMEWPIGYGYSRGYTDRITLRYSISERDAYDHGACIEVYGGVANTYIYNNVVYYIPERSAGANVAEAEGACLATDKWGKSGVPDIKVYNNIFVADKGQSQNPNAVGYLVRHASGTITANNNLYWTIGTTPLYYVSRKTGDFAWWQSKGYDANGLNANPQFTGPFGGGDTAYALQPGSPAINAGTVVTDWSGNMGTRDYFGGAIPNGAYDIGVDEY
jgi:hypothetical protein